MTHLLRSTSIRIASTNITPLSRTLLSSHSHLYLHPTSHSSHTSGSFSTLSTSTTPIITHPTFDDPVGLGPAPRRIPPSRGPKKIQADIRFQGGSRIAQALRKKDLIPGVIFTPRNSHEKILISIPLRAIQSDMALGGSMFTRVYHISVPGYEKPFKVVAKGLALNTLTDQPMNVSFLEFEENKPIKIRVPIYVYNVKASAALNKGYFMGRPIMSIWCSWCGGDQLPAYLLVDVAKLDLNRPILVRDLHFPPGLSAWYRDTDPVLQIDLTEGGAHAPTEVATEQEEEAEATPAAGTAAATPAAGAKGAAAGGAKPAAGAAAAKPADKKK